MYFHIWVAMSIFFKTSKLISLSIFSNKVFSFPTDLTWLFIYEVKYLLCITNMFQDGIILWICKGFLLFFSQKTLLGNFIFFWPYHAACGILVPQPGIEPMPPTVEVWCLNHWTAREVLAILNSQSYGLWCFQQLKLKSHNESLCGMWQKPDFEVKWLFQSYML